MLYGGGLSAHSVGGQLVGVVGGGSVVGVRLGVRDLLFGEQKVFLS